MNFLSHFYLDQNNQQPDFSLGLVLPDLIKNAGLNSKLQLIEVGEDCSWIFIQQGWKRHLELDAKFHNTEIFKYEVHFLFEKMQIQLPKTTIRNSFLAHIAFELMLDHALLRFKKVYIDKFYQHLVDVSRENLVQFFTIYKIASVEKYIDFHHQFIEKRYLYSYESVENISYALIQICKRVWGNLILPLNYQFVLTQILEHYAAHIYKIYQSVFLDLEK